MVPGVAIRNRNPADTMVALSKESQDQLQAWLDLRHQASGFIKSMALAVALDLGIADAIHRRGGAATLAQILHAAALSPFKLHAMRRLMRVLTVMGTFAATSPAADGRDDEAVYELTAPSRLLIAGGDIDEDDGDGPMNLSPILTLGLHSISSSPLARAMCAWFRQDPSEPCPYALAHGKNMWERAGCEASFNTLVNDAMASDSRFTMRIVLKECGDVIFGGISSLVDVAGGVGGAANAIASAFPGLRCSVLDLPHVVAGAPSQDRVQFVAGDMFQSIPQANAVFLKVTILNNDSYIIIYQ